MTEFPIRAFGAEATLDAVVDFDCELMLGIVSTGTHRRVVLAVDELDGGAWLYLTVPIEGSVTAEQVADPTWLRALLTEPSADVRELADVRSGMVHEPVRRPIPDAWLPSGGGTA